MIIGLIIFREISIVSLLNGQILLKHKENLSNNSESIEEKQYPYPMTNSWEDNGTAISIENEGQEDPQICSDGSGGAIITWYDSRGGDLNRDIYAQKINSTGDTQWDANGIPICTAIYNQEGPQICRDGSGGAIITWYDNRSGTDYHIYAQRINSTGDVQWTTNGVRISTEGNWQVDPQLCGDGSGGAIITWDGTGFTSDRDIYAQRINSTGDVQWTTNGVHVCNASDKQRDPQIISDGSGGAVITWDDTRGGDLDLDIYAQRVNSAGDTQWDANGTVICNATADAYIPQICSDGSGGAIITWWDERGGGSEEDIYAQRVNYAGDTQWDANGTAICTEKWSQYVPQICNDSSGGAIITWRDERSGDLDIYAQKINSTGDIQWDANGTAICIESESQADPQICSDGSGGAIITWYDNRGGNWRNSDIYTQKINSSGIFQWKANGVAICNANSDQDNPTICSDGYGGVIITWMDNRSGNYDIYALLYNELGSVPESNHPDDITTTSEGSETIGWKLSDDFGPGMYRVHVNNTINKKYVWVDWMVWINDVVLNVAINRTALGIFNYTIEYNNSQGVFGLSDTVIMTINSALRPAHDDDDDDNNNGTAVIPFGYYYLLFTVISIISLIIALKQKVKLNKI